MNLSNSKFIIAANGNAERIVKRFYCYRHQIVNPRAGLIINQLLLFCQKYITVQHLQSFLHCDILLGKKDRMGKNICYMAKKMKRYSAKILFQYCEKVNKKAISKRRLCEERIITFKAKSAKEALAIAMKKGSDAKYNFKTIHNTTTYFEFIGIKELLCLENKCEDGEVCYEHYIILEPMERKAALIPSITDLEAIKMNE